MGMNMARSMASKAMGSAGRATKRIAKGSSAVAGKASKTAAKRATTAGARINMSKAIRPGAARTGSLSNIPKVQGAARAGSLVNRMGPARSGTVQNQRGGAALFRRIQNTGIGTNTKSAVKQMGKNLSDAGWNMAKSDVARRAVRGAATGAAVGAGVNIAQGEDAWEGAGRGMMVGGTLGAGVSGVRMATGTGKNQNVFQGASAFANKTGVSKSVEALGKMAGASRNNPLTGAKMSRWR